MADRKVRVYEELITLQDKAIEALTQANAALVLALEAVKKARAEHGFALPMPGITTIPNPSVPYTPNTVPNGVPWGGQTTGSPWVTWTNASQGQADVPWQLQNVNDLLLSKTITAGTMIAHAKDQKQLAMNYINAFQSAQVEEPKIGGCVSTS